MLILVVDAKLQSFPRKPSLSCDENYLVQKVQAALRHLEVVQGQELFPKILLGQGSRTDERLLLDRMHKKQASGVQVDRAIWVGFGKTIFEVSPNRTTDGGQLGAYLVGPSRNRTDLQKKVIVEFA